MQPKDYFKKTFVLAFVFYIVYKAVGLIMNRFEEFNVTYILKTVTTAFVTALVLGGINYYAKVDFFTKKGDRKSTDK